MSDNLTNILSELQHHLDKLNPTEQSHAKLELAPILDQPANQDKLLTTLNALISEGNLHRSETWAAHMTPTISASSLLGHLIAGLHNGNLLSPQLYPILAAVEQQTIKWLCNLFQQQHGHFVAGSSYANLEALWQAKQQCTDDSNIVYTSQAAHYSIAKACRILDLEIRYIATDSNDRLLASALQQACEEIAPLAIVATAGTPATGVIDPVDDCINIARQFGAWIHIDAAWGGALAILPEYQPSFGSLSQANSICFDPHKGWQQPKPASVLLYQRPLKPMFDVDTNYLEHSPINSLPGSRGGESFLPLWLSLIEQGIDPLRKQIRQCLQQAELFSEKLQQQTNWLIYPSSTGIVCFQATKSIDLTHLVAEGMFSQAKVAENEVYRAVFVGQNASAEALITALEPYF